MVAPFLLVGATDSRHYPNITAGGTHVYRFNALKASLKQKDISRVHGIDERIEVGLHPLRNCLQQHFIHCC